MNLCRRFLKNWGRRKYLSEVMDEYLVGIPLKETFDRKIGSGGFTDLEEAFLKAICEYKRIRGEAIDYDIEKFLSGGNHDEDNRHIGSRSC